MTSGSNPLGGPSGVNPAGPIQPSQQVDKSQKEQENLQVTLQQKRIGAPPALVRDGVDNSKADEGVEGTAGLFELLGTDDLGVIAAHIKQNASNITAKTLIDTQRYAESEFGDTPDFDQLSYTVRNVLDEKYQQAKRGIVQKAPNPIEARAGEALNEKESAAAGKGLKVAKSEHKVAHKKWHMAEQNKALEEAKASANRQGKIADAQQREIIALNPNMRKNVVGDGGKEGAEPDESKE